MKNYLKVDDRNRRLIMDRTFDKNRRIVGSDEYLLLRMAKSEHKGYELVLRHIKTNPEKKVYKHLTYDYMYEYIRKHPNSKERKDELDEMIFRARCHKGSYGKVKDWFLAAYPDISDFTPIEFKATQDKVKAANEKFEIFETPLAA